MSEVIVVTSGKGCWQDDDLSECRYRTCHVGEKVILIDTDIGLRNLDVVMGLRTASSTTLWTSWRELPSEAGTDKGQKISEPVFTSVRPDQGQVLRDSRSDAKSWWMI